MKHEITIAPGLVALKRVTARFVRPKKSCFVSLLLVGLLIFHPLALHASIFPLPPFPFALSPLLLASSQRATVRVNAESTARRDTLTLGDVANVKTNEPQLAIQLRAITLGYAPQVGAIRELSREKITLAISAAGFTPDVVGIEAPSIALVRREAQVVDQALVRQAVENSLKATLGPGTTAALTRLDLPSDIEVPAGLVEVRASVSAVRTLFLPFSVPIEFWVDGRLVKRLSVTAQAEAFAPVLVAAHDIGAKTRLREGDFKLEVRPLTRNPSLYLNDPIRLRGTSLVHSLPSGEAITTDALASEIVVKTGDQVRIVGKSGALSILVVGEARAAGRVGDRVQVKNLQSGMLFQAVIVDEGVVSVRF
jgi:flagella basal body P-ring formation protein FlgA